VHQARATLGLGLAAQVADVDLEGVGGGREVEAPDFLEDALRLSTCRGWRRNNSSRANSVRVNLRSCSPRCTSRVEVFMDMSAKVSSPALSSSLSLLERRSSARRRASSSSSANGLGR